MFALIRHFKKELVLHCPMLIDIFDCEVKQLNKCFYISHGEISAFLSLGKDSVLHTSVS